MGDSSGQSSSFWTLTRPSKLSKRRNSDLHELHHKVFNISVVGLSGSEKDRGPIGIGKSCLCNRFVRSAADDYHTNHLSVLSQSDFGGRIVNNDHWLYWGSVIKSGDGYDLAFNVVEQTEFVDDSCFQPFNSGKTEPYFKRCANNKLVSPEKLMYICKDQLGVEREYEQRYLPDGKFSVDGFLCLFDVSELQGRNIDKQIEMTNLIMLNLMKTRKPIVFVTTKNDEASELLLVEAERLINQRDFRGIVPIVETSAQENVNINTAFLVCAQMIDKTRNKLRVLPYYEAHKNHLELLNSASEAYLNLVRSTVIDYRSTWQTVCMKLSHNPEFLQFTYLHGFDKATQIFKNHLMRLRNETTNQKVQGYLRVLPGVLDELVPPGSIKNSNNHNSSSHNNNNHGNSQGDQSKISDPSHRAWELTKDHIRSHPLFDKYFIMVPHGISWYDTELPQSPENRIPFDWLDSEEAFSLYQQKNLIIETENRRQETRTAFAKMLSKMRLPVGKPFIEMKNMFAGNAILEILSDQELFEMYVEYQNKLLQQARSDFQELLLENDEHLQRLTSCNKVIGHDDIKAINAILQHDERYQALDRFDQDRTLMIIRHLSFLLSLTEQCAPLTQSKGPITGQSNKQQVHHHQNQQNQSDQELPPPKPSRMTRPDRSESDSGKVISMFGPESPANKNSLPYRSMESASTINELYATRPLPPIPVVGSPSMATVLPRNQATTNDVQKSKNTATSNIASLSEHPQSGSFGVNTKHDATERTHQHRQHPKSQLTKDQTNSDNASFSDVEEDIGDDDSQLTTAMDDRSDKPKPGRLDLTQFENLTNAIGKLNVHATIKTAADRGDSPIACNKSSTNSQETPSESSSSSGLFKSRTRKLGAKNHGRAVAPPQLPPTSSASRSQQHQSVVVESAGVDKLRNKTSRLAMNNSVEKVATGDSFPDLGQSPIGKRLIKQSKDYKVSELDSPLPSDIDSPTITDPARKQKLQRGRSVGLDGRPQGPLFANSSIESSELMNSRGHAIRQLNEILANKQPPGRHGASSGANHGSKSDISACPDASCIPTPDPSHSEQQQKESKKDKKKLRDDEKLKKRRLKDEERLRRQEKKLAAKKSKSGSSAGAVTDANAVGDDGVPLFIRRCIEFIEYEGLDAEGIYRVPGNRAHVDAFVQKFKENPDMCIEEADLPVNAVATALKDFLSKKWGPIIPMELMNEISDLSSINDKEDRVMAIQNLVQKLPANSYGLLRYVIAHFVRVSENQTLNSMDSKNLAICWWPTLLPLQFNDMVMFEQMRPHLEESIQTMIDRFEDVFSEETRGLSNPSKVH